MKKNILMFVTDEHRLSGIGAYGNTPCKTPNIDKLAENGVIFENNYTSCPLCSPARASFITGQHIHTHGLTANECEMGCGNDRIADSPDLLGRKMQNAGYACGYNSKWHISGAVNPTQCGFEGYDYPGHGSGGHYYADYKDYVKNLGYEWKIKPHEKDGEKITGFGITDFPEEATVSHYLTNNTIGLIDKLSDSGKPFFIWHNDWGPHGEHWVPQEYYDMYCDIDIPEWKNYKWNSDNPFHPVKLMSGVPKSDILFKWEDYAEVLRYYYAFCTLIDHQVGRIVKHLEKKGLLENTIIIFTADHRETLGSHGGITNKGWSHFEEIQKTPMIVYDPSGNKNKRVTELTSLLDVYATLCDYAETDYSCCQGRSLKEFITAGGPKEWRDCVFVEFFGLSSCATNMVTCIDKSGLKYGWTCSNKDELYDLKKDPDELHNLIDDEEYKDKLDYLRKCMYTFMEQSKYPAAYAFKRNVLEWNIDRQYINGPDSIDTAEYIVDIKW